MTKKIDFKCKEGLFTYEIRVRYVILLMTLLTSLFTHLSLLMTLFTDLFPYAIRVRYVAIRVTLLTHHSDSPDLSLYGSLFTYVSLY